MKDFQRHLFVYLNLAIARRRSMQVSDHDRLLVLASEAACELGLRPLAEYCRQMVLKNNPGHMIGRYSSVNDALASDDFQFFLRQVRRRFSIEYSETELDKLKIDYEHDLVSVGSVDDYLSRLLGVEYAWIQEAFDV